MDAEDYDVQSGQKGDFTEILQETNKKIVELIVSDKFVTTTQMVWAHPINM